MQSFFTTDNDTYLWPDDKESDFGVPYYKPS
jgi:hypothetical protein